MTAPLIVAALVLAFAGAAKLVHPQAAALAGRTLGLPAHPLLVRAFAAVECGAAVFAVIKPENRVAGLAIAVLYGVFSILSLSLARRRANCGCFGESDVPATAIGSILSAGLALVALAAVAWPPHDLSWIFGQSPLVSAVTVLGVLGAAYATVIAYTELPSAWSAWSAR